MASDILPSVFVAPKKVVIGFLPKCLQRRCRCYIFVGVPISQSTNASYSALQVTVAARSMQLVGKPIVGHETVGSENSPRDEPCACTNP